MPLNSAFYDLTQDFQGALFQGGIALNPDGAPAPSPNPVLVLRRGYAESPAWLMVQAQEFDPEPLSVERIRVRAVWSSERIIQGLLDLMASEGWLDRIGDDYLLTDGGREIINGMTARRYAILSPLITHLRADEVDFLEKFIRKILDASLAYTAPPETWSLAHSRHRAPANDEPTVVKLFQYCADINAYRDDSHMAAFQPLNVPAYAWEAFSLVWNNSASTPQTIFENLHYRGYSRTEYAHSLSEIAQRGWLTTSDGETYSITADGQKIRDEIEQLTDHYFYQPWSALTETEIADLHQLMTALKTKLENIGK